VLPSGQAVAAEKLREYFALDCRGLGVCLGTSKSTAHRLMKGQGWTTRRRAALIACHPFLSSLAAHWALRRESDRSSLEDVHVQLQAPELSVMGSFLDYLILLGDSREGWYDFEPASLRRPDLAFVDHRVLAAKLDKPWAWRAPGPGSVDVRVGRPNKNGTFFNHARLSLPGATACAPSNAELAGRLFGHSRPVRATRCDFAVDYRRPLDAILVYVDGGRERLARFKRESNTSYSFHLRDGIRVDVYGRITRLIKRGHPIPSEDADDDEDADDIEDDLTRIELHLRPGRVGRRGLGYDVDGLLGYVVKTLQRVRLIDLSRLRRVRPVATLVRVVPALRRAARHRPLLPGAARARPPA
jgi:hypothetical protein